MYVSRYNLVFDINEAGRADEKILYNPLARSLDVVSVDLVRLLARLKRLPGREPAPKLGYLFQRGYLFRDTAEEERRVTAERELAARERSHQVAAFAISPTYACDLRCTYCFQQYMDVQYKPKLMSIAMIDRAAEFIARQVLESGMTITPVLVLFGGEPLMSGRAYREATEAIIDRCKRFGIPLAAVTNGVHLEEYVDKLAEAQVYELKVTFSGSKRVHDKVRIRADGSGTYDQIARGVQGALDRGLPITINCVGDREMYDSLPELIEDCDRRGWIRSGRIQFQFQHECSDLFRTTPAFRARSRSVPREDAVVPLREDHAEVRLETLRCLVNVGNTNDLTRSVILPDFRGVRYILDNGRPPPPFFSCSSMHHTWALDVDGNLYNCVGCSGDPEAKVGEFHPEPKLDRARVERWRKKSVFDLEKCRDCDVRFICASGCARLKVPSDPADPVCEPIQEILQIGFDYYFPRIEQKWLKRPRQYLA